MKANIGANLHQRSHDVRIYCEESISLPEASG
jgi:hypothetical protein